MCGDNMTDELSELRNYAAELRKALEYAVGKAEAIENSNDNEETFNLAVNIVVEGSRALKFAGRHKKPVLRNCDVGTAEEQADRFFRFCNGHQGQIEGMCDPLCPCVGEVDMCHCLTKWANMPYEAAQEEAAMEANNAKKMRKMLTKTAKQ